METFISVTSLKRTPMPINIKKFVNYPNAFDIGCKRGIAKLASKKTY